MNTQHEVPKTTSRPVYTLRSIVSAVGLVAACLAISGALLDAPAEAGPPDPTPGATQPMREQNLDTDGLIRVHEQGTANVNVTNSSLAVEGSINVDNFPSSFEVSNLPSVQDVEIVGGSISGIQLAPVTTIVPLAFLSMSAQTSQSQSFAALDVTTILINDFDDDEISVLITSPLLPGPSYVYTDASGDESSAQLTFFNPIPVDGLTVECENESENCTVSVTLFGF